jgi:hypothetical protein
MDAGCIGCLQKPFEPHVLLDAIGKLWPNRAEPAANAIGTAASAGAPGVSALASGTVAPGVFPPARLDHPRECYGTHDPGAGKAFIAPSAARSPKECSP